VIFAGGPRAPVAVMGVRPGQNLFIAAHGQPSPGAYLPAAMRRWPFILADDAERQRSVLCIDRDCDLLNEEDGEPLFEDGEAGPLAKRALDLCAEIERDRLRTRAFMEVLQAHDLLEPAQAVYTPRARDGSEGPPEMVRDFFRVSSAGQDALGDDAFGELRRRGYLRPIHAHLMSLQGWSRLYAMEARQG